MSDDNSTTTPPEETEEDALGHVVIRRINDAGIDDDTEGNRLKSKPSE
jgi:hypothetical protein